MKAADVRASPMQSYNSLYSYNRVEHGSVRFLDKTGTIYFGFRNKKPEQQLYTGPVSFLKASVWFQNRKKIYIRKGCNNVE